MAKPARMRCHRSIFGAAVGGGLGALGGATSGMYSRITAGGMSCGTVRDGAAMAAVAGAPDEAAVGLIAAPSVRAAVESDVPSAAAVDPEIPARNSASTHAFAVVR